MGTAQPRLGVVASSSKMSTVSVDVISGMPCSVADCVESSLTALGDL
ncbi:hypothetical protein [Dactylosporangium sp. CA-233914]